MASNINRITGLATGLDTDSIIEGLMKVERIPLDKLKQKEQLTTWKMEAYREVTTKLTTFKKDYMNVLNQASNMLSKSNYKVFTSTIMEQITGSASSAVSITTNAETPVTNHTIKIERLAKAAIAESSTGVTKDVQSSDVITNLSLNSKKLKINLDGIEKTITLSNYANMDALVSDLNGKIMAAFGKGVDDTNSKIEVSETSLGSKKLQFTVGNGASALTMVSTNDSTDALSSLNLSAGDSNRLSISTTLGNLKTKFASELTFGGDNLDELKFSINGEEFIFDEDTTLTEMMTEINSNTDANVIMKYDEVNDKFTILAKTTGTNISISQTEGNFFGIVSNIDDTDYANGEDAKVILDDQEIVRNSNSFTVNNVKYNLKATTTNTLDINMSVDTDKIYENIKTFIEKYNEMIDSVNTKVDEEYDRDYQPLTDEQKESMTDEQITIWETKAKTGLLENDSTLKSMVYKMRTAMMEAVGGVSGTLSSIGISTSSYEDEGKLTIDETKLKAAIESDPDKVVNLFAKKSESTPSYTRTLTLAQRTARYNEEGIANRLSDILDDNISTYRDVNGNKGTLVEKAGIVGDASEVTNFFIKQIIQYQTDIDEMQDKLDDKESRYYQKYAALETAIQKMNAQASSFSGMMGGSSSSQ